MHCNYLQQPYNLLPLCSPALLVFSPAQPSSEVLAQRFLTSFLTSISHKIAVQMAKPGEDNVVGIGILGCANIARKNVRAISLAEGNMGKRCYPSYLSGLA